MSRLLEINNLSIHFGNTRAVDGLSLHLEPGETLGLVGESGSGKSITALSVLRLLPESGQVSGGEILFRGADVLKFPETQLTRFRGSGIAMIFQEPMTSLNPVFRCGHQVMEAIQLHQKIPPQEARERTLSLFEQVRLPDPARIFDAWPHQLSGGQKQRVMIAMAMSCHPDILIADEPTTALDVTVQKTILDLMRELQAETGLSMLFISHDLGVISEICDRVAVMHTGKVVEEGTMDQILNAPEHAYTRGLVACRPSIRHKWHRLPTVTEIMAGAGPAARVVIPGETAERRELLYAQTPILSVKNLTVRYPAKKNWLGQPVEWLNAVDKIDFEVFPGETFGLAGESGCGKTTLGRAIAHLTDVYSGVIQYKKIDLEKLTEEEITPIRRDIQMVFQDPYSSLNPRLTVEETLTEPLKIHKLYHGNDARRDKAAELLRTVGLQPGHLNRYPHEFSGGQRQRICIARALALEPKILICDEVTSSLDVSVQATVLNLLMELQEKFGLTYLFISHDLSVIKQMCDRLMIMNRGREEALGFPENIFEKPEGEYVKRLIEAVPGRVES